MAAPRTPPGWYPDPWRQAEQRWWDGAEWTGHTAPRWRPSDRKTPWLVIALSALALLVLAGGGLAALIVVGRSDDSSDESPTEAAAPQREPDPPDAYVPPGTNKKRPVEIGAAVSLTDQESARVRFTVRAAGPAPPPTSELFHPPTRRQRVFVIRVAFAAVGSRVYDDSIYNGLSVVVGAKRYRPVIDEYSGCPDGPVIVKVRPGTSRSGCFLFKLPRGRRVTQIRFWPSSENAPDVAYWRPS